MTPAIVIQGLCKRFGAQIVLDQLNLEVQRGELFIVMGLSGTGKSVTLKHLLRLIEPDAGNIYIDGQNLQQMNEAELVAYLKRVGMVFQNSALFDSMSSGENIAFPLREHGQLSARQIEQRVDEMLQRVRLAHAKDKNPADLSGGMRKRIGLARALVLRPDFVFFDEPTSGLDLVTGAVIEDLILETHREFGYTGLVITHHWELAQKLASRVALLWAGGIHWVGTPNDFAKSTDPIIRGFLNRDPRILETATQKTNRAINHV